MKTPAFVRLIGSLTALTLAARALAPAIAQDNGSVSDFQLPSEQATPRARAQGPVLDDIPAPRVVRPTPTPAPAPPSAVEAEPAPAGAATSDPFAAIDAMGQTRPVFPAARATPRAAGDDAATDALPGASPEIAAALPSAAPPVSPSQPTASTVSPAAALTGGIGWGLWLLGLVAVGALGVLGGWLWRGRKAPVYLLPPPIERPKVPERAPEPIGPPAELPRVALSRKQAEAPPEPVADEDLEPAVERPLRIALEPARLSVSLLNATLAYRILLTNQGESSLLDISIDGDMISAHASLSQEEQLAAPNSKLENRHLVRTLAPGETKVVRGEFALPLPRIRPIRRGEATLFVPLARLRVVAGGESAEVLVQTSVVGQRSLRPGGGLRPFRLDLGPRIYSELGQRAFA